MQFKSVGSASVTALAMGLGMVFVSGSVMSDVWVFAPSISIDQRFDDNFFLSTVDGGSLSATRGLGELGVSREARNYVFKGLGRLDALYTTQADIGPEEIDSNRFLALSYTQVTPRSRYGLNFAYTRDTPSRDITADISENTSATDTGLVVTQLVDGELTQSLLNNVVRNESVTELTFEYDVSRRLIFDASAAYTRAKHKRPSDQDVIYQRYLDIFALGDGTEPLLGYNEVTVADTGVFTVEGELDDFEEIELTLGLDYSLSPISSSSVSLSYSRLNTNIEYPESFVIFEDKDPDSDVPEIRRNPRYDSTSTTGRLTLGYERFLTPTLRWSIAVGAYADSADALLEEDARENPQEEELSTVLPSGTTETDGFLANTSLSYDAGRTQYRVAFVADVQPSSVGSQIETNTLTGQLSRALSPRLNFSLQARAYEPDRVGALVEDEFARRFFSFEPRIDWKVTRNWTATAAYRYRRQRARVALESAESNALLFAIEYAAPSKIRDAAQAVGL